MRVFKTNLIKSQLSEPELEQLTRDFKQYKQTGIPADTFGRDALYDYPHTLPSVRHAELRHLHIIEVSCGSIPNSNQYYRTSDDHLVYCEGFFNSGDFLMISILSPNAHAQARKNSLMFKLAEMAEDFRNQY